MSEERKPESANEEGDVDTSVTDTRLFRRSNQVAPEPQAPQQVVAPDPGSKLRDEEYNMRHRHRGLALIFNHYRFADTRLEPRLGTQKDCDDLSEVLTTLGFNVNIHHDLPYLDILRVLQEAKTMDHTDADCLLVAVMTHGLPGLLLAYDNPYPVDYLWENFIGENCLSLVGKPKIFIIQACRGTALDKGVAVTMELDSHRNQYILPVYSDILLAHSAPEGRDPLRRQPYPGIGAGLRVKTSTESTVEKMDFGTVEIAEEAAQYSGNSHYSWRNEGSGSWFIQALVRELTDLGRTRDLLSILTFVNQRVAIDYQSHCTSTPDFDKKKIIPSFTSMLTRLVYFR